MVDRAVKHQIVFSALSGTDDVPLMAIVYQQILPHILKIAFSFAMALRHLYMVSCTDFIRKL